MLGISATNQVVKIWSIGSKNLGIGGSKNLGIGVVKIWSPGSKNLVILRVLDSYLLLIDLRKRVIIDGIPANADAFLFLNSDEVLGATQPTPRPQITIVVESKDDDPTKTIRGLRWLLKRLLRNYGLKCVSITRSKEADQ